MKDKVRAIALIVVGAYFLIFLAINLTLTDVSFLFFAIRIPVIFLILFSALIGAGLTWGILAFRVYRNRRASPADESDDTETKMDIKAEIPTRPS